MIIYYIIIAPLFWFIFKVFQPSLWIQLLLILLLTICIATLKYLEKEAKWNHYIAFFYNLYPLQVLIYYLLRLEEFIRENVFLGFTLLTLFCWIILHGWLYPGTSLICVLGFSIYFVGISYSRLRWNLLNDTYLNLYKGRDSFEWQDVIVGMQTHLGNVNNRLNSNRPFQYIPKRQSAGKAIAEKVLENPEVQKALVVGTLAAATAVGTEAIVGIGNVQQMLSSEEKQAMIEATRALNQAKAAEEYAFDRTAKLSYSHPISDEGKLSKVICEEKHYAAVQNLTQAEQISSVAKQNYENSLNDASTLLSGKTSDLMDTVSLF